VHVEYGAGGKGVGKPRLLEKTGEVSLHPSSCAHRRDAFESDWLIYHDKVKTSRVFVRDVSAAPLQAILLFAQHVEIMHASHLVVIDRWVRISANPRTAVLFKTLRNQLNSLLEAKMRDRHNGRRTGRRDRRRAPRDDEDEDDDDDEEAAEAAADEDARAALAAEAGIIQNIATLLAEPEPPAGQNGTGGAARAAGSPAPPTRAP
jgi:hypothetical protein